MTAPAPPSTNVINNHVAKRAPSRHDSAGVLTYPVADVLVERGIPFIFATGYGSGGLKEAYSARTTLQKPFNMETRGQAIRQALGRET
jgi:hypothetical protein